MSEKDLPIFNNFEPEQLLLKAKLKALQNELDNIQQKTVAFEMILRSHLENEIIEEQELNVLYKKMQQAKKEKRLAQKRKGKNFKEKTGIKLIEKSKKGSSTLEDQKEKKRLYREAMLFAHPDKFSMQEEKINLATEITTKLIEIYASGSLDKLRDYHTHICTGNALKGSMPLKVINEIKGNDLYLEKEIIQIELQLENAKNKQTYKVLTEYENPLTFIVELKEFYVDRIFKLKKRTRKAN